MIPAEINRATDGPITEYRNACKLIVFTAQRDSPAASRFYRPVTAKGRINRCRNGLATLSFGAGHNKHQL
jgi:hypothetical protein